MMITDYICGWSKLSPKILELKMTEFEGNKQKIERERGEESLIM